MASRALSYAGRRRGMSLSYVHGAGTTPLIGETIGTALERAARMHGTPTALVSRHQNIRGSYAELNERADTFATGLLALELAPGDRIGIWAPNCAEWTLTQFAAAKAGLILVNINTAYRKSELEYALNKVGCRVIVLAKEHRGIAYREMLEDLCRERRLPQLEHAILIGETRERFRLFDEIADGTRGERDRLQEIGGRLQFDDPINIQ